MTTIKISQVNNKKKNEKQHTFNENSKNKVSDPEKMTDMN